MKPLAALLFALMTLPAGAADFVLNVPVRLNNIHRDVAELFVNCFVSRVASGQTASVENVIGRADPTAVRIPPGGDYSGSVRVSIDALPGKNPADAVYYKCYLTIQRVGSDLHSAIAVKNPLYLPGPGAKNDFEVDGPIRR